MAKVTPWFPPEVKPVREGWYEATLYPAWVRSGYPKYKWNGKCWTFGAIAVKDQQRHWRGLASKPK